jgi:PTS system mannose-specific IIA component
MAGILIIAHAPFATALRDCIAHIYGGLPARIGAIDVTPDCDPVAVLADARVEAARLAEQNGTLILTDMFGATPSNIACQLAEGEGLRVLSGVNLPMLVRAVCYRTTPLDTLVDKALSGGTKGMHECSRMTAAVSACMPCAAEVAVPAHGVADM